MAMSENTETAILAGGCFWPAQELLRHRAGDVSERLSESSARDRSPIPYSTGNVKPSRPSRTDYLLCPRERGNRTESGNEIQRPSSQGGRSCVPALESAPDVEA